MDKREMPADKTAALSQFLPKDILMKLKEKTRAAEQLQALWRSQAGSELATRIRATGYQDGVLNVIAESSVWAAKMRHQGPALVRKLRTVDTFKDLQKIHVRIEPIAAEKENHKPLRAVELSEQSRALIEQVASGIDDIALKTAMLRLSGAIDRPRKGKRNERTKNN
ncbi:MAG: DUF721 domain-containing protein [Gammaproteobacteria bacterium]|nr:DUF721 domain-containing protein [Gammaproteobacteria bacterium]